MNTRAVTFYALEREGCRPRGLNVGDTFYNVYHDTICRFLHYDILRDIVTVETCPWRTLWWRARRWL